MDRPLKMGMVSKKGANRFEWIVSDYFSLRTFHQKLLRSPYFSLGSDAWSFGLLVGSDGNDWGASYVGVSISNRNGTGVRRLWIRLGIVGRGCEEKETAAGESNEIGILKIEEWVEVGAMTKIVDDTEGRLVIFCEITEFEEEEIPAWGKLVVKSSGFKCRHCIAMMGFVICFYFSASRINMSVTIVDMVNNSGPAFDVDAKSESCPGLIVNLTHRKYIQRADKFNWSPAIQGYILGCYYLIYIFMQIPFGKLVEKHGCKRFLVLGTMVDATGTLVIPTASRLHPYALIAVQVVRGAAQGTYIASVTLLAANWFPKTERGLLFTSVLSGFSIGTFCGSVLSGYLCQSSALGGWPSAFYVYGFSVLLLSGAIGFFIHDNPSSHPRITPEELAYILSNQENQDLSQERPNAPWTEIFKSAAVHALTVAYFGQNWAISQFLLVQSTFLGTILHYPIDQNGFYSAVPFLFMFLCTQMSSGLSALMINKKWVSVNFTRKFWNFVACSGFSACLLGVYFAGCNRLWSIVFSVLSVGFIGFGESGSLIASTDMSPKFAASLNAFCNVMGVMPCFILPLIVGYITNETQTIEQWNKVFFISIGVVMTSGAVFSLFGSAEVQRWNFTEDERRPEFASRLVR